MRRSRGQGKVLKASIHVLTQTSVILLSYTLYHFHLQFTVCGVVPAGLFECATPQARRGTRAPMRFHRVRCPWHRRGQHEHNPPRSAAQCSAVPVTSQCFLVCVCVYELLGCFHDPVDFARMARCVPCCLCHSRQFRYSSSSCRVFWV